MQFKELKPKKNFKLKVIIINASFHLFFFKFIFAIIINEIITSFTFFICNFKTKQKKLIYFYINSLHNY